MPCWRCGGRRSRCRDFTSQGEDPKGGSIHPGLVRYYVRDEGPQPDPCHHAWTDARFATEIPAEHGFFLSLLMPPELVRSPHHRPLGIGTPRAPGNDGALGSAETCRPSGTSGALRSRWAEVPQLRSVVSMAKNHPVSPAGARSAVLPSSRRTPDRCSERSFCRPARDRHRAPERASCVRLELRPDHPRLD